MGDYDRVIWWYVKVVYERECKVFKRKSSSIHTVGACCSDPMWQIELGKRLETGSIRRELWLGIS